MEIGSEFWKYNKKYISENEELFLSGRTALDAIIKDILSEYRIESALLPSYCCHTMIEPFIRNQIPVRFYDVFLDSTGHICSEIPESRSYEIFYDIKYFGNNSIQRIGVSESEITELWDVVIEDTTHSCFSNNHSFTANYEYASFRKWMALDGIAIAKKKKGSFSAKLSEWMTNREYCEIRNQAFRMKDSYISDMKRTNADKVEFLNLFNKAEQKLSESYVGLKPDVNTVIQFFFELQGIDQIRAVRRRNAQILTEGIKDIKEISVLTDTDNSLLCPFFVSIAVDPAIRDFFKKYLISHEIYCPVHWPLSKQHKGISERAREIYARELSLVCDQRYGKEDMERELEKIKRFFLEN